MLYFRRCAVLAGASSLALMVSGCGDENSTAPPSAEFPRAFTSRSATCTERFSLNLVDGLYEETIWVETVEASAEALFAGPATIILVTLLDLSGALVDEEYTGEYRPSAADGTWNVTLTPGPADGSFTATGTGTDELSGHSIDFDMEPLSEGCGYTSSGTIR